MYVYELALALQKLGHKPYVYTPILGKLGRELEALTIPVFSCLENLRFEPDIIHGHHHLPTMTALTRFPNIPAVFFCHGWTPQEESPPLFPRIMRYVAVSQTCYDRLIVNGVPEKRIQVLLNFVDMVRFKQRSNLSLKPQKALIFSNSASEESWIPIVRQACEKMHIQLDVVGAKVQKAVSAPELVLRDYDIVFAVGKAALEALSVGVSLILCDYGRIGPLVCMDNVDMMRHLNFGLRVLDRPLSVEEVCREIAAYDAENALRVSSYIRESACLNQAVSQLVALYQSVIMGFQELKGAENTREELHAVSRYLAATSINRKLDMDLYDKVNKIDQKIQFLENCYRFILRIPIVGRLFRKYFYMPLKGNQ